MSLDVLLEATDVLEKQKVASILTSMHEYDKNFAHANHSNLNSSEQDSHDHESTQHGHYRSIDDDSKEAGPSNIVISEGTNNRTSRGGSSQTWQTRSTRDVIPPGPKRRKLTTLTFLQNARAYIKLPNDASTTMDYLVYKIRKLEKNVAKEKADKEADRKLLGVLQEELKKIKAGREDDLKKIKAAKEQDLRKTKRLGESVQSLRQELREMRRTTKSVLKYAKLDKSWKTPGPPSRCPLRCRGQERRGEPEINSDLVEANVAICRKLVSTRSPSAGFSSLLIRWVLPEATTTVTSIKQFEVEASSIWKALVQHFHMEGAESVPECMEHSFVRDQVRKRITFLNSKKYKLLTIT